MTSSPETCAVPPPSRDAHDAPLWDDPDAPPAPLPEGLRAVALAIGDQNGLLRGKRIDAAHWPSVCRRGMSLDDSFFAMDCDSLLVPNRFSGPETGYPDLAVRPRGPLMPLPGEPGVALSLGEARLRGAPADAAEVPIDPRPPLLRAVAAAQAHGFVPRLAAELEFYLLDPATLRPAETRDECYGLARAAALEPFLGPLRQDLTAMGLPVEQSGTEVSAGQVEVNLGHAPALVAMDHALIFRAMVKQAALRHGRVATFMPQPFTQSAGSGFHLHHSLWRDGRNLFAHEGRLSDLGRWYLGGLQAALPELALVGCVTPNGHRRRRPGAFAPRDSSWGVDNRTAALRVMHGDGPSDPAPVRIESRHAGADANPYLLAAVELSAGLRGIERRLEPSRPTVGDAAEAFAAGQGRPALPATSREALAVARPSSLLREVLGDARLDLLCATAEREIERMEAEVTEAERARYLEIL
ncbi:MAG: glutamine synthetase family protein [Pseudomonadota bacterium]